MENQSNKIKENLNALKLITEQYKAKICEFRSKNSELMTDKEKKYYSNHFIFSKSRNVNLFIEIFLEKLKNLDDHSDEIDQYLLISKKAVLVMKEAMNVESFCMKTFECILNKYDKYKKSFNQENKTEFLFCYSKIQHSPGQQNYKKYRAS